MDKLTIVEAKMESKFAELKEIQDRVKGLEN